MKSNFIGALITFLQAIQIRFGFHSILQAYCNGNGQFPYLPDCHKYVNCWQGGIGALVQSCHPSSLVFNPQTRVCTWEWDPAVKDLCNLEQSPSLNNDIEGSGNEEEYSNENNEEKEELCPSDYSGLTSYPYSCKKFVECWKGKSSNL